MIFTVITSIIQCNPAENFVNFNNEYYQQLLDRRLRWQQRDFSTQKAPGDGLSRWQWEAFNGRSEEKVATRLNPDMALVIKMNVLDG